VIVFANRSTKRAIGAAGFREQMDKKAIEIKRPRRGRQRK